MSNISLDYKEIMGIVKDNLNVTSTTKNIEDIFLNKRYFDKIDFKPYFQRNYVWDPEKASYFIESIFLGTEIPPIVMFDNGAKIEIIDGRQRFETVYKFISNEITLKSKYINTLLELRDCKFMNLPEDLQVLFKNATLRILYYSVTNEPYLSELKEDLIKKEIFRRYNSGITSLKKPEIQRAKFIEDDFSNIIKEELENKNDILLKFENLFLSSVDSKKNERDKINIIMSRIRNTIGLLELPIHDYAKAGGRQEILDKHYFLYQNKMLIEKENQTKFLRKIISVLDILVNINNSLSIEVNKLDNQENEKLTFIINNRLIFETLLWAFLSCEELHYDDFNDSSFILAITEYLIKGSSHFDITGSHYYMRIKERYDYIAQFFITRHDRNEFHLLLMNKQYSGAVGDDVKNGWRDKIIKKIPISMSIDDITRRISSNRFLIRPIYQRGEAISIIKASSLIESIILGVKVPPIFVYKRKDGISEVVDGQQRLLSIIGFLGREYKDENFKSVYSKNNNFELKKLKILSEIEGMNGERIKDEKSVFYEKILDFEIDIIEINFEFNPNFDQIDLFLRLNSKPYEISENSFEMWNSYGNKELISNIKSIYKDNNYKWFFKNTPNKRMKSEELLTAITYLEYETKINKKSKNALLNIYIRNERVSARIGKKEHITKMLEECNLNEGIRNQFDLCIKKTESFIKKVQILLDTDNKKSKFDKLLTLGKSDSRTDRDYYLLWYMFSTVDDSIIRANRLEIFLSMQDVFKMSRTENNLLTSEKFLEIMDNKTLSFTKLTGTS